MFFVCYVSSYYKHWFVENEKGETKEHLHIRQLKTKKTINFLICLQLNKI